MEIDNQYETTENACVTTMRSQQLSSPTPPSEELRQTGRDMAVALVDAAPADLTLRDLDDVTLDREIAEQEGLVASNPSMAKYMQLSLQLHQAERQRRNVALGPALLHAVAQSTLTLRKSKEAPRGLPKRARPVWLNNGRHPSKLGTFQNIEGLYKYDLGDGPRRIR